MSIAMETFFFLLDLSFNLTYTVLIFMQKVIFNYFGGIIVIMNMIVGYYALTI